MTPEDVALNDLRRELDAIDDAIHDVLMRRSTLAEDIRRAKGGNGGPATRPGREAAILRRLLARHQGAFSPVAIARIWREIMAVMTLQQGPVQAAVCVPPGDDRTWEIARDHFGTVTPMTAYQNPGAVVRAVSDDNRVFGVLPLPRDDDRDPWWRYLVSHDDKAPRIFYRIPFVVAEPGPEALVIGRVPAEATEQDRSFVVVETTAEISRARLVGVLQTAGCDVSFITSWAEGPEAPQRQHLAEVAGFVAPGDPVLATIAEAAPEAIARVFAIGAYPAPILVAQGH